MITFYDTINGRMHLQILYVLRMKKMNISYFRSKSSNPVRFVSNPISNFLFQISTIFFHVVIFFRFEVPFYNSYIF